MSPDRGLFSAPVPVRIRGERFDPGVSADFSTAAGGHVDVRFEVRLGGVPLEAVQLQDDGSLTAVVPAGLPTGPYDVEVVDPAGRTGVLSRGYRVLPAEDPTVAVAGFRVEASGNQEAFRPFEVTITAVDGAGAPVTAFNGAVRLSDSTATVVPATAGLFVGGRWTGRVEIRAPEAADVLTATDDRGSTGASAPFAVAPAAAALVRFETAPLQPEAGRCEGPVTLGLRDAFGAPTTAAAATPLSLVASQEGFSAFADPSCATPLAAVTVPAGEVSTDVWYQATRAGPLDLSASGGSLADAEQRHTVAAAAPAVLAFVTPPQTIVAGSCSAPVTLRLQDGFGNAAPAAEPLSVVLSASPVGPAFHAGAGCMGAPVTSVAIAAGASDVGVSIAGTTAGAVNVAASAAGISPDATQAVTIAAAPPDRLVFVSAPQTTAAGACSGAVRLESRDAYGNPSPVAVSTQAALSAAPAAGFTFHADAGCGAEIAGATLAPGTPAADLHYRGTVAGTVALGAAVTGWTAGAVQTATVTPGDAARLAWAGIPSPQGEGRPFAVSLRALDGWGNVASGFTGTATVTASSGAVDCRSACSAASTTGPFSGGTWTGSVAVQPAAAGVTLLATAGALAGTSNAFDVIGAATRSPPLARFSFSPAVVLAGQSVTFDATASSDYQTPSADLAVSWQFQADAASFVSTTTPPAPPWTAWTTAKAATHTYPAAGTYHPRLAVRDGDPAGPDVGYATATVVVLASASGLCVVTTPADVDDGATSCSTAGARGPDGQLSLREAVRLANGMPGGATPFIAFTGPMTISGSGTLTVSHRGTSIVAEPGVVLDGLSLTFAAAPAVVAGLELTRLASPVTVQASADATLRDVTVRDGAGVLVLGRAALTRVRMRGCAGPCVRLDDPSSARVAVWYSELLGSGGDEGIRLDRCGAPEGSGAFEFSPIVGATVLGGFATALRSACTGAAVVNDTFVANGTAVSGTGAYMLNNVFSGQTVEALTSASCASAFPYYRRQQLLWDNVSHGSCLEEDLARPTGTLEADPRYVFPAERDYRIQHGSAARDAGDDFFLSTTYAIDLNDPAPARYFGAAIDRGGRETY